MSRPQRIGKTEVVARSRKRETPVEEEVEIVEENPRRDLLKKYGLKAEDYKSFTNIEFSDLIYSLETYGVQETLDSLKVKDNKLPKYAGPRLPYVQLLEEKRNEYDYMINYNPKASIALQDCIKVNCRSRGSVTFVSSINYRADESFIQKFKCQVCGQFQ
jgi:hypothetical protein